jgi:hypothetical protein
MCKYWIIWKREQQNKHIYKKYKYKVPGKKLIRRGEITYTENYKSTDEKN